ncbi:hypothetical protein [Mucilaginibacter myungsuensis]|uniref:Uncharacterized protein n=1 Tax=Mucilaginibacter myungsuensis TaxID=649104 RepID=A0A929KZ80_9SPHI|nr:hypothetical protein [Mucilaginibacter myungsuensis]MBE9664419.1 hypothetical protein [Mucilaginibacter myungsuensis]MDN3597130.1 hypothetical protein [Mucilaginibacter myungsuensis]
MNDFSPREIILSLLYGGCIIASIGFGIKAGFTGTHTAPIPFITSGFALLIGGFIAFIDIMRFRPVTVENMMIHIAGLAGNGLIMAIVLSMAFN